MVATPRGGQVSSCCYSSSAHPILSTLSRSLLLASMAAVHGEDGLLYMDASAPEASVRDLLGRSTLVPMMLMSMIPAGLADMPWQAARMHEDGGGDGPGHVALCRLVLGANPAASDSLTSAGCTKLTVPIFSSRYAFAIQRSGSCRFLHMGVEPHFCARFIVHLYGIDEEDVTFNPHILLEGIMEASSWNLQNSISNFTSKMIAALDIMQQSVATVSMQLLIPRCAAIMVMVRSSDLVCSRILDGAVNTVGSAIHLIEQNLVKSAVAQVAPVFHCQMITMLKMLSLSCSGCVTGGGRQLLRH